MSPFAAKPLTTLTVGETLRQAREEQGWKINELAKDTAIHPRFIQALEEDRHQDLPGDIYVRHWLRQLCVKFKLNSQNLVEQWLKERQIKDFHQPFTAPSISKIAPPLIITGKQLRWWAVGLVSLALIAFLGSRIYAVVNPPLLTITHPANNTLNLHNQFSLEITGQTNPEALVTINNQVLNADLNGNFTQMISLKKGLNQITITAKKKHGLSTVVQRTIIVGPYTNP